MNHCAQNELVQRYDVHENDEAITREDGRSNLTLKLPMRMKLENNESLREQISCDNESKRVIGDAVG